MTMTLEYLTASDTLSVAAIVETRRKARSVMGRNILATADKHPIALLALTNATLTAFASDGTPVTAAQLAKNYPEAWATFCDKTGFR